MRYFKPKSLSIITALFFIISVGASVYMSNLNAFAAIVPNVSAKISFTFDDGLSSALIAGQTLQSYGFTGTNYIITSCVGMKAPNNTCAADKTKNYMSWQDISTLHSVYGWEIGSHTVTHPLIAKADNPSLTDAILDNEMRQSQVSLQANGYNAFNFATPYGDYDNKSIAIAAKYYSSFRTFQDLTYSTDPIANTFPYYSPRSSYPYNNYLLTVLPVQGNVSVATVQGYIDQAKVNKQWLILVFHEIKADTDTTYNASLNAYQYTAGNLGAIAAYAKSQSVPVVNMNDGLASGTNIMPGSSFNNGIADGWTTDSTTTIVADKQTTIQSGHGSFDGTTVGALNSVHIQGSAADTHLFSPRVSVVPGTTYTLKNFVNVTSNSGELDFYIDEFDVAGNDLKTGSYVHGVTGTTDASAVQVGDVNFIYTPTSANATSARLQLIVHGVSTTAYVDNLEWLSPDGAQIVTPPPVVLKAGDVNGDGTVNALDLSTVLSNWNKAGQTRIQGDLNGDGTVNALDLSTILSNWSK